MASTVFAPRLRWTAALLALGLSACSLIPTYERPAAPVAPQWPSVPGGAAASVADATKPLAADIRWQDFVNDARLRALVELALANNRDLRVAALTIEQARAQYQINRANQLPTVSAGLTGSYQPGANGNMAHLYTVGLTMASWEIDLFGRLQSLKEAALAQFFATQEARNAVQTSLVASVVSTWLSLQTDDELLALTERTLATREESLKLIRMRFEQGVASELDLRQAESLAATARATFAQQKRQRALDFNVLTLLVGQSVPASLLDTQQGVQLVDVPAGMPSDLLTRRPDIRQAEQQLIAANANIGAARAAFFPRISLTASAGNASNQLSDLFSGGTWVWTQANQTLLTIFDAGRNQAGLDSARAGREIAVAQYEKAIQTAFREVSDALAGRATLGDQVRALQQQVDAALASYRLSDQRYRSGVASHLELLDAQRTLFAAQQALAQTQLAQRQNQVLLYKALGGGWSEADTPVAKN
ncbi:MAG: efflux transporter outer membrane subunit [Pseudomonadota bacterium]